jgi:hypothetical protein
MAIQRSGGFAKRFAKKSVFLANSCRSLHRVAFGAEIADAQEVLYLQRILTISL